MGNLASRRARKLQEDIPAYLIPGSRHLAEFRQSQNDIQKCVVLFAHGGGYARGEARMYVNYMERWITKGAQVGLDLAFVTVEYRKSFA